MTEKEYAAEHLRVHMKLTYDPRYNIAYLRLYEKPVEVETIEAKTGRFYFRGRWWN